MRNHHLLSHGAIGCRLDIINNINSNSFHTLVYRYTAPRPFRWYFTFGTATSCRSTAAVPNLSIELPVYPCMLCHVGGEGARGAARKSFSDEQREGRSGGRCGCSESARSRQAGTDHRHRGIV